MDRTIEVERRTHQLIENFAHFVLAFDDCPAFIRFGQHEYHFAAIQMRRRLGSAAAALDSDEFMRCLHVTLQAWGIGGRTSVLAEREEFSRALRSRRNEIVALGQFSIDGEGIEFAGLEQRVWELISSLTIVQNEAKLVSSTMALHHFLPDLIVPIDRKSTRAFFAWHVPEFQYQQERVFRHAFRHFRRIALATNPEQYVATGGWKTSRTKVIDNAVVAFCVQENLRAHGQRRRSLRGVGRREVLAD